MARPPSRFLAAPQGLLPVTALRLLAVAGPWVGSVANARDEVEHVKCQVCKLAVQEAKDLHEAGKLLRGDEEEAVDAIEALCSTGRPQGRWLTRLDLEQEGAGIKVVRQDNFGECRSECRTVQRACERGLAGHEDAFMRLLVLGSDAATLESQMCEKACAKAPKPLHGLRRDESFQLANSSVSVDSPGGEPSAAESPLPDGSGFETSTSRYRAKVREASNPADHSRVVPKAEANTSRVALQPAMDMKNKEVQTLSTKKAKVGAQNSTTKRRKILAATRVDLETTNSAGATAELHMFKELNLAVSSKAAPDSAEAAAAARGGLDFRQGPSSGEEEAEKAFFRENGTASTTLEQLLEEVLRGNGTQALRLETAASTVAGEQPALSTRVARKEEVEHVKCQICELAVQEALELVERDHLRGDEDAVIDAVEALCSVKRRPGRWLTRLDLQQEGDGIRVVQHSDYGECRSECLTVQRACAKSLQGKEALLTQLLLQGAEAAAFRRDVCGEVCRRAPVPLVARRRDEAFKAKGALEVAVLKFLDELEAPQGRPTPVPGPPPPRVASGSPVPAVDRPLDTGAASKAPVDERQEERADPVAKAAALTVLSMWLFCRPHLSWGALVLAALLCVISTLSAHGCFSDLGRLQRSKRRARLQSQWSHGSSSLKDIGGAWSTLAELAMALDSQEQRLRSLGRSAERVSQLAIADVRRAMELVENLLTELEQCDRSYSPFHEGAPSHHHHHASQQRCTRCGTLGPEYRCSGCGQVWYCGLACQRRDWNGHKIACGAWGRAESRHTANNYRSHVRCDHRCHLCRAEHRHRLRAPQIPTATEQCCGGVEEHAALWEGHRGAGPDLGCMQRGD